MEERVSVLKNTFGGIVDLKEGNIQILKSLDTKIQQIKTMYTDFIQTNREQLFVFTLDAFHFQSKLVDLEFEDMNRMFLSIINRMYCDYYKLFKIMVEYVEENIPDKKLQELIRVHNNFPIYKDLEPFRQYDFQFIQSLHEIILVILTYIHTFITNKEHDLKVYQTKNQTGLNIDSFVSTFSFNTIMMNQRAGLFINYVEFFHKSHTKYLKRFMMKMNLMLSQLNSDIKLDMGSTETKSAKKDMIDGLKEHNLDKNLLKELKVSISAPDDSSVSDIRSKSGSRSSDPETFEINQSEIISDLTDDYNRPHTPKFTKHVFHPDCSIVSEEHTTISSIIQDMIPPVPNNTPDNTLAEKYTLVEPPEEPSPITSIAEIQDDEDYNEMCEPSDETINLLLDNNVRT
jgi:hypothetical protein